MILAQCLSWGGGGGLVIGTVGAGAVWDRLNWGGGGSAGSG